MKIQSVEIFRSPLKLKKPFVISLGTLTHADNIIVKILTDTGITGYGECSPFASINGETADTCVTVGILLAKNLLGADPADHELCASAMDRTIYGNSSIKSAMSIAMYDIASQSVQMPLYRYLGAPGRKEIITDFTVTIGSPEQMASEALEVKESGFGIIKVKLGENGKNDILRIEKIRASIGEHVKIKTDANQGWSPLEAIDTLNSIYQYDIEFCEEPIARWQFMSLRDVSDRSLVPVMADESCCDHHDAERLIELGSCKMFNIKLGKSSGILNALRISKAAEEAGITLQAGGFLESRLGFTATAHLGLACKNIIHFDLDSPLFMTDDPIEGGLVYQREGRVEIPENPGLGAMPDKSFLKGLDSIKIS